MNFWGMTDKEKEDTKKVLATNYIESDIKPEPMNVKPSPLSCGEFKCSCDNKIMERINCAIYKANPDALITSFGSETWRLKCPCCNNIYTPEDVKNAYYKSKFKELEVGGYSYMHDRYMESACDQQYIDKIMKEELDKHLDFFKFIFKYYIEAHKELYYYGKDFAFNGQIKDYILNDVKGLLMLSKDSIDMKIDIDMLKYKYCFGITSPREPNSAWCGYSTLNDFVLQFDRFILTCNPISKKDLVSLLQYLRICDIPVKKVKNDKA